MARSFLGTKNTDPLCRSIVNSPNKDCSKKPSSSYAKLVIDVVVN